MRVEYVACTAKGSARIRNEDRVMINNEIIAEGILCGIVEEKGVIAVVCDGVGSTDGGAEAAEMIAKSFMGFDTATCSPLTLSRHLHKVNRAVVKEQSNKRDIRSMASTTAGLILASNRFIIFGLGDTRIYKFIDKKLSLITKDHTVSERQQFLGFGSDEAITCYIGGGGYVCYPSFRKGFVENDSLFVICSDGVYKSLENKDIENILCSESSLEQKEKAILNKSLQNGSTDDMSLVLIKCYA